MRWVKISSHTNFIIAQLGQNACSVQFSESPVQVQCNCTKKMGTRVGDGGGSDFRGDWIGGAVEGDRWRLVGGRKGLVEGKWRELGEEGRGGRGLSEQGTTTGPGAPTGTIPGFAATLILFTQVLKNCCSSNRGGMMCLVLRLDWWLRIMNPDTWGFPWLLPCHILQLRWDWENTAYSSLLQLTQTQMKTSLLLHTVWEQLDQDNRVFHLTMLSWSWINCDFSGREQFYLSGHFRSPGKSTGGQWQLIIREKGNHTGISSLWWSIRMSVRIIMLDNDFKMKDISQQLWRLHETGLCLCCPVWGRHVRHIAKIVDGRWCPSVLFYSCVGDLSLFRELDRWNHFWEKLESSKSALGDLWQKVTHEMRWAPYTRQ